MKKEGAILVAEDNDEQFSLISKPLLRAGIWHEIFRFVDGQQVLDFLFRKGRGPKRHHNKEYILFLNADIPKVNGIDLLTKIKKDDELKKMPVIILATKDDTQEVELCHELGCSIYIAKPTEPKEFVELIRKVGLFLSIIRVPQINGVK